MRQTQPIHAFSAIASNLPTGPLDSVYLPFVGPVQLIVVDCMIRSPRLFLCRRLSPVMY